MIKEVIFDIDSTLYDYDTGHAEGIKQMGLYIREQFGIDEEEFEAAYKRLYQEAIARLGKENAAIHSRSIRIQNLLEEWKLPLFPHLRKLYRIYWDSLLSASAPEPGSLKCLKNLREMGMTIGIGTDMTAMIQYEKLETYGFAPYINHIVTSQEAGAEKPARAIMDLCVKKSGVRPEECLFVGDNFNRDVQGAVGAGMHAVWYNPKGKARPENPAVPEDSYHAIRHFDELIPYIKSIR